MIDGEWLADILETTPARIGAWRSQARQLQHLVTTAEVGGVVSDGLLQATEETCTAIYAEINRCAEVTKTVAEASPEAASQLALLADALHLVLLEVTELATELYSVRSRLSKLSTPVLS